MSTLNESYYDVKIVTDCRTFTQVQAGYDATDAINKARCWTFPHEKFISGETKTSAGSIFKIESEVKHAKKT